MINKFFNHHFLTDVFQYFFLFFLVVPVQNIIKKISPKNAKTLKIKIFLIIVNFSMKLFCYVLYVYLL